MRCSRGSGDEASGRRRRDGRHRGCDKIVCSDRARADRVRAAASLIRDTGHFGPDDEQFLRDCARVLTPLWR